MSLHVHFEPNLATWQCDGCERRTSRRFDDHVEPYEVALNTLTRLARWDGWRILTDTNDAVCNECVTKHRQNQFLKETQK